MSSGVINSHDPERQRKVAFDGAFTLILLVLQAPHLPLRGMAASS